MCFAPGSLASFPICRSSACSHSRRKKGRKTRKHNTTMLLMFSFGKNKKTRKHGAKHVLSCDKLMWFPMKLATRSKKKWQSKAAKPRLLSPHRRIGGPFVGQDHKPASDSTCHTRDPVGVKEMASKNGGPDAMGGFLVVCMEKHK